MFHGQLTTPIEQQGDLTMLVLRIHRSNYPNTDHGRTWVEHFWFQRGEKDPDDGRFPVTCPGPGEGFTERLGAMPGGPVGSCLNDEIAWRGKPDRVVKTSSTHPEYHVVGTCCIHQDDRPDNVILYEVEARFRARNNTMLKQWRRRTAERCAQ